MLLTWSWISSGRSIVTEVFKAVWYINIHLFKEKLIVVKQKHSPANHVKQPVINQSMF